MNLAAPLLPLRPLTYIISGGSGGAIYAFIFGWVGTFASFMVLAELASMYASSPLDDTVPELRLTAMIGHLLPEANTTGQPCLPHPNI